MIGQWIKLEGIWHKIYVVVSNVPSRGQERCAVPYGMFGRHSARNLPLPPTEDLRLPVMPLWTQAMQYYGPQTPGEDYAVYNEFDIQPVYGSHRWTRMPTSFSTVSFSFTTFSGRRGHWGSVKQAATMSQLILETGTRADIMIGFDAEVSEARRIKCPNKSLIRFRRGVADDVNADECEPMQYVLILPDFVKNRASVCTQSRYPGTADLLSPVGPVIASRHGRWIHAVIHLSRAFYVQKELSLLEDRRLISPDGTLHVTPTTGPANVDAGMDVTWTRVFHREWRDRIVGQSRMNSHDHYEEHFSVVICVLNPSARHMGAARTMLMWRCFERYLEDVASSGETDAPLMIVFYPEAPWLVMDVALEVNSRFSRHSGVAGQPRIEKFMNKFGYRKHNLDVRGQAMVFLLEPVAERVEIEKEPGVLDPELQMRREIMVNELCCYQSADPAWELPGLLTVRSSDSPDGQGSDGRLVREFHQQYGLTMWSSTDFQDGWAEQIFDTQTEKRRIAYYDRWESWQREESSVYKRWVGFPPVLPSAPWGRPGYDAGGRRARRGQRQAAP